MRDVLQHAMRSATKGVIFDTNVLIVFLVGLWNPTEIPRFKRTSAYSENDFILLLDIAKSVGKIVTTPHILTEACNLCDTLNRQHGNQVYGIIAAILEDASERRQEAVRLTTNPLFMDFGLADMSLIDASTRRHLIVTDDVRCYVAISNIGGLVINVNHLRGAVWLKQK
jgi:hypothetical protein